MIEALLSVFVKGRSQTTLTRQGMQIVSGTGNVNGIQIFPYNNKGIPSQMSNRRQVVNNGQNLVSAVCECPLIEILVLNFPVWDLQYCLKIAYYAGSGNNVDKFFPFQFEKCLKIAHYLFTFALALSALVKRLFSVGSISAGVSSSFEGDFSSSILAFVRVNRRF